MSTPWHEQYKVEWKEGTKGHWALRRFTVTPEDEKFGRLRSFNPSTMGRYVPAGEYTGLYRDGHLIMSDTPDEVRDCIDVIRHAHGRGLINGLGLGMIALAVLKKETITPMVATAIQIVRPTITHLDIVEIDPDVIELVGDQLLATGDFRQRLTIHCHDALDKSWPRGTRWNFVWHDIWDDVSRDNLLDITRLHRRYGHRTDWQDSWSRDLLKR